MLNLIAMWPLWLAFAALVVFGVFAKQLFPRLVNPRPIPHWARRLHGNELGLVAMFAFPMALIGMSLIFVCLIYWLAPLFEPPLRPTVFAGDGSLVAFVVLFVFFGPALVRLMRAFEDFMRASRARKQDS